MRAPGSAFARSCRCRYGSGREAEITTVPAASSISNRQRSRPSTGFPPPPPPSRSRPGGPRGPARTPGSRNALDRLLSGKGLPLGAGRDRRGPGDPEDDEVSPPVAEDLPAPELIGRERRSDRLLDLAPREADCVG